MLPELKPYLTALALPPLSPLLLIAVGWWGLQRRRAWAHVAIALGVASLWLLSCSAVSVWLSRHLLPQHPMVQAQDFKTQQVQAVVVLGGGVEVDLPDGVAQLSRHSLDRLRQGVQWARVTQLPLMFTGGVGWGGRSNGPTEAEVAQRVAQDAFGWPLRWAESQSRDTQENAHRNTQHLTPTPNKTPKHPTQTPKLDTHPDTQTPNQTPNQTPRHPTKHPTTQADTHPDTQPRHPPKHP